MPVASLKAALIASIAPFSPGSEWLLPIWIVPVATLAAADAAADGAAADAAADGAAALGAVDAAGELQAAMIAGMDTRPAAPAMPLRTVRRETAFTRVGSAMVLTPPLMLPDKIRQDQPDCPHLQR